MASPGKKLLAVWIKTGTARELYQLEQLMECRQLRVCRIAEEGGETPPVMHAGDESCILTGLCERVLEDAEEVLIFQLPDFVLDAMEKGDRDNKTVALLLQCIQRRIPVYTCVEAVNPEAVPLPEPVRNAEERIRKLCISYKIRPYGKKTAACEMKTETSCIYTMEDVQCWEEGSVRKVGSGEHFTALAWEYVRSKKINIEFEEGDSL